MSRKPAKKHEHRCAQTVSPRSENISGVSTKPTLIALIVIGILFVISQVVNAFS